MEVKSDADAWLAECKMHAAESHAYAVADSDLPRAFRLIAEAAVIRYRILSYNPRWQFQPDPTQEVPARTFNKETK